MRMTLLPLLTALVGACGGGVGGPPAAPTLTFSNPAVDMLHTIGPGGAPLLIAFEVDNAALGASTTLYAEMDGAMFPIVENRPHDTSIVQVVQWDVSVVPEGVYTIVAEINDGAPAPVRHVAPGTVTVTAERSFGLASSGYDGARGVSAFPDGSYAAVGRMTMPHLQFRGTSATIVFGAGEPNETSYSSTIGQGFVARYKWDGTLRWVTRTYGSGLDSLAHFTSVAAMPDGGVVAKGEHFGNVTVGRDEPGETTLVKETGLDARMLARYARDGALMWAITMRGEGGGAGGVVADADGSIFLADTFRGGMQVQTFTASGFGQRDPVVMRLDADGNVVWVRRYGSAHEDRLGDIALAADGAVLVCGNHESPIAFGDFDLDGYGGYIVKIDRGGHVLWARNLLSSESPVPTVNVGSVASAPDGSVYATGRFTGTQVFGAGQTWDDRDTGAETGSFLMKLGSNGSVLWLRLHGAGGGELCAHADHSATVVGSFSGTMKAGEFSATSGGGSDRYFLRIAPDGSVLGLRTDGTDDHDRPSDIDAFPDRSTVVGGSRAPNGGFEISDGFVSREAER